MTVKEDKKKWNIPWKPIKLTILIGGAIGILAFTVLYSIQSTKLNREAHAVKQAKVTKIKTNDVINKQYDITCKNIIISKSNYKVVKVKDIFRIFVGENNNELDKTYKLSQCNVIYNITKEIK